LRGSMNYQIEIRVDNRTVKTLADILPSSSPIKMLIIGKTPAPISVSKGHYFQGRQGKGFWNLLRKYGLLHLSGKRFDDEALIEHGYGITDVVKTPHEPGREPTDQEYKMNWHRVSALIDKLRPHVTMFVYKGALNKILKLVCNSEVKASYGFNSDLDELFGSKLFVFPMPGTRCTAEEACKAMNDLRAALEAGCP